MKNRSLPKTCIMFAILFASGCASNPFKIEIATMEQDSQLYEKLKKKQFEGNKISMKRILEDNPNWEKTVSDDIFLVECFSTSIGKAICETR